MRSKKGFTLVEVLVAMFIFTIAMVAISEIFVSFIRSYRTARVMQKDLQDAQQASNYISKTLRTSTVMSGDETSSIIIYDYSQGKCIQYKFADDGLFMNIQSPTEEIEDPIKPTTCDGLFASNDDETKLIDGEVIEEGKFVRSISSGYDDDGTGSNTAKVGIVTVLISLKTGHGAPLNIQTSASLRDYEKTINPEDLNKESKDKTPPKIDAFNITCPTGDGMSATIDKVSASDPKNSDGSEGSGIDGYLIKNFASGKKPAIPVASDSGWNNNCPEKYTTDTEGKRALYLFVKDKSGNIESKSSSPETCTFKTPDEISPGVTGFNVDSSIESDSLNVSGMKITATDNSGSVTACKITRDGETEPTKSALGTGWGSCDSVNYVFPEYDTEYTLYPWARDTAGNVSEKSTSKAKKVTIIKPDKEAPKINAFEVSSPSYSMNVKIDKIAASDDVSGVAKYCIKEGGVNDTNSNYVDCSWKSWPKGEEYITNITYEVKTEGERALSVWVKDYKDKVSSVSRKNVTVWNYIAGPCPGFLVRGVDTPQEEWATGSGYSNPSAFLNEEHCVAEQCDGDPGITSSINSDSVKFSWTWPSVGSLDARQACKDVNGILPNRDQLQCIQKHKDEYLGIGSGNYWTSEEIKGECVTKFFFFSDCDYSKAYQVNMSSGSVVSSTNKQKLGGVRCIRPTL